MLGAGHVQDPLHVRGEWLHINTPFAIVSTLVIVLGWIQLARQCGHVLTWTFPFYIAMNILWAADANTRYWCRCCRSSGRRRGCVRRDFGTAASACFRRSWCYTPRYRLVFGSPSTYLANARMAVIARQSSPCPLRSIVIGKPSRLGPCRKSRTPISVSSWHARFVPPLGNEAEIDSARRRLAHYEQ